ncbi:MAG: hypothetical protein KAH21_02880 [Spirochaetaceae bacterium]|nr:hypothetical protein [Spirochaetaceae bacterium]
MKLRTAVVSSYIFILAALIALSSFTILKTSSSLSSISFIQSNIRISVSNMQQIDMDIIEIQQWLTDASATGYMDGFDLAEEYFQDANQLLTQDIERKKIAGKPELADKLVEMQALLQIYYDVGKTMAHEYVDHGREAGNIWMDKFDPLSVELVKMAEEMVLSYNAVYDSKLAELKASQSRIITLLILISGSIILIVVLMAFYISIAFSRGISLVSVYSDRLSKNDISESKSTKRKDEFGITANQFRNSFKSLNSLVSGIKTSTDTTATIKDSLAASAEEASATIVNIKNNTASLLNESERMNQNVTDNVTSIEEITANINSINNQITEQASMVEESTASITEMISSLESVNNITKKKSESIDQLVDVVSSGSQTLTGMAEGFKTGVVDRIEGISEMASAIQQIASQTNLLSMNAAIEAAHAGDAGKGFAVVADEIRKLAETSAQSSASISKIIKEISDGVMETEIKTKKSSEAFDVINTEILETKQAFEGIALSTQELNVGGKQILDAMTMLQDVTITVKGASEEMASGSAQVVRGQLELKDISDQVAKGMQEISSGSEQIVVAADEIVNFSVELNSVVASLKEETDKFKT